MYYTFLKKQPNLQLQISILGFESDEYFLRIWKKNKWLLCSEANKSQQDLFVTTIMIYNITKQQFAKHCSQFIQQQRHRKRDPTTSSHN